MAPPSTQQITQVVEMLNLNQGQALTLLKKNNNDVERSIDAYFTDQTGSLQEDQYDQTWQAQDNIPYADDAGSTGALPATRPPSRVDNPQEIQDLTATHAEANATARPNFRQEEDDLQRAIDLSLGKDDSSAQENGVTGTGQQFGPATKGYYNPAEWAVVPVSSSREIVEHPPPTKRRRLEGQPAFLRGSKDTGYLGPLLTIYSNIPLAREAFLLPSLNILQYGHDPSWWSGTTDESRKSLSLPVDQTSDTNRTNLLAETQCLMAFLEKTDRAYGSVDALADLDWLKRYPSATPFSRFLEAWRDAAMSQCPQEQLTQIFGSTAMKDVGMAEPMSKEMVCLEPAVNRIPGQLLVDLLDNTVWDDDGDNLDDVWISQAGEIFTMRMYDPGEHVEGLKLSVPAVWYPDRYTWALRDVTREMRQQIQVIRRRINQYYHMQRRLQVIISPDRRAIEIKNVLQSVADACPNLRDARADGQSPQVSDDDINSLEQELKGVMERAERKIAKLDAKKDELYNEIRKITSQLTEPSDDPHQPPFMKYVLQGVATKQDVTYVRRRNTDLLGLDEERERPEWQWWRIAWSQDQPTTEPQSHMIGPVTQEETMKMEGWASENPPYSITKVTEKDVIEAAREEHHSVVLVYANENAIHFENIPLSPALKDFVEQDNISFARELKAEMEPQAEWAEGNGDTFDEIPLRDHLPQLPDREMTPMSISSPHRDEDGQPSPKRPKSSSNEPSRELPPSYEESTKPEMQERKQNKIGLYAEQMLEKYGHNTDSQPEALHIEHSPSLPR